MSLYHSRTFVHHGNIYDPFTAASYADLLPPCNKSCIWAKQCEEYIHVDTSSMFDLRVTLYAHRIQVFQA